MKKVYIHLLFILICCVAAISCSTNRKSQKVQTQRSSYAPYLSESDQRKADYYFDEGLRLKATGQHDAAFDAFSRAAAIDTVNAASLYSLSNYYLSLRNPIKALNLLQKAILIEPDNYWYLYAVANLAQQLNMNEESIEYYKKLIATNPNKPELIFSLSEVYTQLGNIDEAIQTLDSLEEKVGINEVVSLQKFKLYLSLKDEVKAKKEMDKLIAAYPNEIRYPLSMGDMLIENDRRQSAKEYYDKAKKIDPDDGYLQLSLANYYSKTGDQDSAEIQIKGALYNKNLEIGAKLEILKDYLQTLYMRKDDTKERDALFDILFESYPQEKELFKLQASYLIAEKRFKEAQDRLNIAVGLDPDDKGLWLSLLDVCLRLQEFNEVVNTCKQALVYFPKEGEFYYYQSMALGVEEKYHEAIRVIKDGLAKMEKNNPRFISGMYGQMGDIYHQLKDQKKCFEAYDQALEIYPDNAQVLNNYAYFLSMDKDSLSKAEKMSARSVKIEPENSTFLDTYAWIYFQMENYFLAKVYIETAMRNGGDESDVLIDHYGDILFKNGDIEGAVKQWEKALEMGNKSKVLERKIKEKKYIHNPDEFNN
ncbi:MAG: tetratricopeptide repeat protein [Bacteroidales bacterium]